MVCNTQTIYIFIFLFGLCLNFIHLLARKPNLEKKNPFTQNKFVHNFHLSESSFTCWQVGKCEDCYIVFNCSIVSYSVNMYENNIHK